jgi:hypothetical protein
MIIWKLSTREIRKIKLMPLQKIPDVARAGLSRAPAQCTVTWKARRKVATTAVFGRILTDVSSRVTGLLVRVYNAQDILSNGKITHDTKEPQFEHLEIMSRERATLAKVTSRRMEATQGLTRKGLRTRWHPAAFCA